MLVICAPSEKRRLYAVMKQLEESIARAQRSSPVRKHPII